MKRDRLSLENQDHEAEVDAALRKRLQTEAAAKERAERVAQRERAEQAQFIANLAQWQAARSQIATDVVLTEPQPNPLGPQEFVNFGLVLP
jgi:hypothetical protein